jgi:homoserine kinase
VTAFVVRAPATIANVGPGFDCLGLAVDIPNDFHVDSDAKPTVTVEGEGSEELPADASNLVLRTAHRVAREAGKRLPAFALRCVNRIPLERGLGSSAAAVVAGALIADRLLGTGLGPGRILEVAVAEEGHPDNVAACLRGGLVLVFRSDAGWQAERMIPSAAVRPVLLIPEKVRVSTDQARKALPGDVPFADAVFNLSRSALAILALTDRPDLLAVALEDRLHQPHRLALAPAAQRAFDELRRAGVPVCLSGSGPTLVAFETEGTQVPDLGGGWRAVRPRVDNTGARIGDATVFVADGVEPAPEAT